MSIVASHELKLMQRIHEHNLEREEFYDIYIAGKSAQQTLYLLGSYKGVPIYFRWFIHKMVQRNFRVVYIQPCAEVLSTRHPSWLGQAIDQAAKYIEQDIKKSGSKQVHLMGISLGSYLGLNIQLRVPFKKFVVVAGGAPLSGVYRSVFMFWRDRQRLKKEKDGFQKLDEYWLPYDEAFKKVDLSGSSTLFLNTKNDRVIPNKKFNHFLDSYTKTGAKIVNRQKGYLTHSLKVLSVNFRSKEIIKFLLS